jgi:hypothetical protein
MTTQALPPLPLELPDPKLYPPVPDPNVFRLILFPPPPVLPCVILPLTQSVDNKIKITVIVLRILSLKLGLLAAITDEPPVPDGITEK